MVNIGSLSEAIGTTNTAAASVLTASSELTATADTLSREVEAFFVQYNRVQNGEFRIRRVRGAAAARRDTERLRQVR